MSIILSKHWETIQGSLFSMLSGVLENPLTQKHKQLASTLELVRIEQSANLPMGSYWGRPMHDRGSLARAFVAKAVYHFPTTEALIECLRNDANLRTLCGWPSRGAVPSSATFSRAFQEFATDALGDAVHKALVGAYVGDQLVMHVSRDSTEVIARERVAKKETAPKNISKMASEKKKRGRPKKGEERPAPDPKRMDIQRGQSAEQALADLPKLCDWGTKKDTGGHKHTWKGWKAHVDWADGAIPITVITTSASLHDSQAAIPMARVTANRVTSLYDLMDSAYDAPQIRQECAQLGHVALIDPNPRRWGVPEDKLFDPAMKQRYKERTTAERGNSRLKDEFGLRCLRVRGHAKAHLHIMFAVIALFADQILKPFA